MKKLTVCLFLTLAACTGAISQKAYFVDGYHGGIYGHYPVEWKTRFMLDKLEQYPQWRIGLEIEPETWDTVMVRTPEAYADFKRMAADRRIEFTNPAYAQPYCYNVSGESIIRQFQYGIKTIRRHFPDVEMVTYAVEEPCFTSSLPMILNQLGFKYAVLKCPNTCWGGYTAPYGGELVNWIGPDGSSILTVPRYACEELEENSVWQTKAWGNSREYINACLDSGIKNPVGMTYQDAGWKNGPWLGSGKGVKNKSVYVTWREYFEDISAGSTDDDYRFSQEDVRVELMWGSQVLQRIAGQVRRAENIVVQAEKLAAIAHLSNGYRYDEGSMDEAWRTLMMAQHHDSWIVPYNRLTKTRTWADEIERWTQVTGGVSAKVIADALESHNGGKDLYGHRYVRVFNTTGTARSEVVTLDLPGQYTGEKVTLYDVNGNSIPTYTDPGEARLVFNAEVPPFGFATYRLAFQEQRSVKSKQVRFRDKECVVENDMYRIVFDPARGGIITSLVAKKQGGREYVDRDSPYGLGQLRGYFYQQERFLSSTDAPAVVSVVESNDYITTVVIEGAVGGHPFTQTVTLTAGRPRIDFHLRVMWNGNPGIGEYHQPQSWGQNRRPFSDGRYKLNVLFPANIDSPTLYKDAPFDVCESGLEDTFFDSWDAIKHNVILNWVDLAGRDGAGMTLFTDHTTSYVHGQDFPLGLTAQYSGMGLWNRNYPIDHDLDMTYSIMPHEGAWDRAGVSTENNRRNEPLQARFYPEVGMENASFIDLSGTGYEISAVYPTGEGTVLRLYNAQGDNTPQRVRFGFPVSGVTETDLNGKVTGQSEITDNGITTQIPRFGIKNFLITKH